MGYPHLFPECKLIMGVANLFHAFAGANAATWGFKGKTVAIDVANWMHKDSKASEGHLCEHVANGSHATVVDMGVKR